MISGGDIKAVQGTTGHASAAVSYTHLCLEGLHRLVQNSFRFTVSPKAAANVDTIKRSSNNVIDFME